MKSNSKAPKLFSRLRWFGAEYLIVVVGVLTAFGLSAWWQSEQDADKERQYLEQLSFELQTTIELMSAADSVSAAVEIRQAKAIQSFYKPTVTPRDSIYDWIGFGVIQPNIPTPVLGTAKALVSTGDFSLISNQSLKFEISKYIELSELESTKQLRYFDMFFDAVAILGTNLSPARHHNAYHPHYPSSTVTGSRTWFPEDLSSDRFSPSSIEIYNNGEVLRSLVRIANAHDNGRSFRRGHRERAEALKQMIDVELAARG